MSPNGRPKGGQDPPEAPPDTPTVPQRHHSAENDAQVVAQGQPKNCYQAQAFGPSKYLEIHPGLQASGPYQAQGSRGGFGAFLSPFWHPEGSLGVLLAARFASQ